MASEVLTLSIVLGGISKYVSEAKRAEKATNNFASAFDNIKQSQDNIAKAVGAHQDSLTTKQTTHTDAVTKLGQFTGNAAMASQVQGALGVAVSSKQAEIIAAKSEASRIRAELATARSANSVAWAAGGKSRTDPAAMATRANVASIRAQLAVQNQLVKAKYAELTVSKQLLTQSKAAVATTADHVKRQTTLVAKKAADVAEQKLALAGMVAQQKLANSFAGKANAFLATFGLSLSAIKGLFMASIVASMAAVFAVSYKAALEMESFKKKLNNVFAGENGGEDAMKWVRAYALTGKATIAEMTQALVTLGRLGVQPTAALMEDMNNVAILSGRNMGNIAQGIAFALKGSWWMMQRGLGIRKDDVVKLVPKAFDAKGKVVDKDLALKGIMQVMDGPQYQGAADRMSQGMTGISRQITAYIKESLATIGEIPKTAVKNVLTLLLKFAKDIMPALVVVLKATTAVVSGLISAFTFLAPVIGVVAKFAVIFAGALAFAKIGTAIEWIKKLTQSKYALAAADAVVYVWTQIVNAAMGNWKAFAIGVVVLSTLTVALGLYLNKIQEAAEGSVGLTGSLGKIKRASDNAKESLDYMYEALYGRIKEVMDKQREQYDGLKSIRDLAVDLAKQLGMPKEVSDTIRLQQKNDVMKEYNQLLLDEKATKDAIAAGGYKMKASDETKETIAANDSLKTALGWQAKKKAELEATLRDMDNLRNNNVLPYDRQSNITEFEIARLREKIALLGKQLIAENASVAAKKNALKTIKDGVIDSNGVALDAKSKDIAQRKYELMKQMSELAKNNNEKIRQDIVGGGDLGKLGIAKYAIWKRFGDQFIKTSQNGIDVKIRLTNSMESSLNPIIDNAIRQAMEQFVAQTVKLAQ